MTQMTQMKTKTEIRDFRDHPPGTVPFTTQRLVRFPSNYIHFNVKFRFCLQFSFCLESSADHKTEYLSHFCLISFSLLRHYCIILFVDTLDVCLTVINFVFSSEKWHQLPNFPNLDKWGYSIVSLNNDVYVTGEVI